MIMLDGVFESTEIISTAMRIRAILVDGKKLSLTYRLCRR